MPVVGDVSDPGEWDRYVSGHRHATADHLSGWRTVFEQALGHRTRYLVARRAGAVCGVLPLVLFRSRIFGRSVISVPFLNYGGILADDAETGRALVEAATEIARAFGGSHLELRHVDRQCPELPVRRHKVAMTLALPESGEALWARVDRKVRNQVRKAQKEGLAPVSGGGELLGEFYAVFARNMRDLGTPVYPRALFAETLRAFPKLTRVFVIRRGSEPVAAGITVTFNGVALNPWASSLREYRHQCPNMLLYWGMLEQAVADGAGLFDFGRSSPGGGTYQFKQQWGAAERAMHWEYVLVSRAEPPDNGPSNPKFQRVIDLWKRLPMPIANLAGPLIARSLP